MTRHLDDRDPAPTPEWRPCSSEWARKAALKAAEEAVRNAREKRTTVTKETEK